MLVSHDSNTLTNRHPSFSHDVPISTHSPAPADLQSDRSVRNLYKLHSVLVHSGGTHGGHYYAFIRPDGKTW
jgi:uncharacterized UBP type Zn finger protein